MSMSVRGWCVGAGLTWLSVATLASLDDGPQGSVSATAHRPAVVVSRPEPVATAPQPSYRVVEARPSVGW